MIEFDLGNLPKPVEQDDGIALPSGEAGFAPLFGGVSSKAIDIDQAAERKARNMEKALISKVGLNYDSMAGRAVNNLASLASGASRTVGNLVTLPIDAASGMGQAGVPNEAINAYSRQVSGQEAMPGDAELLSQIAIGDDGIPQTNLERMQGVAGLRDLSKGIANFFDISSIVNTDLRNQLSDEVADASAPGVARLRAAAEQFGEGNYGAAAKEGVPGLFSTIGNALTAGVQQPGAVMEYAAENIPQLAAMVLNPVLGASTNVGYAANEYREGMTDFAEANKGALPSDEERTKMALYAASAAAAEQVGDLTMLKGLKAAGSKSNIISNTAAVAGAVAREGVTEGYQTFAENQAHLKDTSIEEVVESATIGGLVGGTYQGAANIAKPARGARELVQQKRDVADAYDQAVETGNTDALTNPKSPSYAPDRAVQALHQVNMKPDTSPEVVAQNLEKADSIQANLTADISALEQRAAMYGPEGRARLAEAIKIREEQVAAEPNDPELKQKLRLLQGVEKQAAEYTPAVAKEEAKQIAAMNKTLNATREAVERMQVDATPSAPVIDEMVQTAATAPAPEATQAGNSLLTLTMTNPDAVTAAEVSTLASSLNLPEAQKVALTAHADAQMAVDNMKNIAGVNTDVITGGEGFKGIPQYRNAVRLALRDGNQEAAATQVDQLVQFAQSRASKATAITAAYDIVRGTDNKVQLVRGDNGVWAEPAEPMTSRQLKSAGGVEVSARSFKLRDAVTAEADALTKSAAALRALVEANPVPEQAAPVEVAAQEQVTPAAEPVQDRVEPAAEPEVAPVERAAPELTAVQNKPEAPVTAENYQDTNLVGAYFDQSAGKDTDSSKKPLASVKDFMSALRAKEVTLTDYIAQKGPITGPQRAAVSAFGRFQRWSAPFIATGFQKNPGKGTERFRFKDYAQFLINEDGSVDENLSTAVSFSMFNWANDNAVQLRNTDAGINAILGKDSDADISSQAYARLADIGIRESAVAADVGADVVQALGLKMNDQAPANELARLEASLGAQVIGSLVRAGMAERVQISDVELQALMNSGVAGNPKAKHTFIRVKAKQLDGKAVANDIVRGVRDSSVGSQSILSKLFGVETPAVEPSYEPLDFTQEKAKRTNQDVPETLAKILNKEAKKPHTVNPAKWHLWENLSSDALYQIAGVISTTDTPTHIENIPSRNAKNDGLIQQVDNARQFISTMIEDKGLDQPLYFDRSVWKPQRVGLTATVLNPQTSKVARSLLDMEGWATKVEFADKATMDSFKLRVLEAFGVKTEANTTPNVLAGYDAKVANPDIQAAVDQLALILRDEHTSVDEAVIVKGVKAGGEGFHSFDGLVALAQMANAVANGATGFTTELTGEVDGVTNGPMLSLLMLGAKGFDTMNQGGFFALSDPYSQFNDYRADGNLDLYQSTVSGVLDYLPAGDPLLEAMQVITGTLRDDSGAVTSKGRNIIKKPLTAMMFGSNTKTAVLDMADGFVDTVYSRIEDAAAARDPEALKTLLGAVNKLIGKKGLALDTNMGIEVAMETKLSKPQKDALKKSFNDLMGENAQTSLNENYALFLARRDTVNQSAQLAFDVYMAARDALVQQALDTSDAIPRSSTGEALTGLTRAQEREIDKRLKDMEPILQTAMSKASDQLSAGMHMSKTQRTLDSTQQYTSEVWLGGTVPTIQPDGTVATPKRAGVSGMRTVTISPGVAPFITSIHSTDSAIASSSYTTMNALNVHDALIVGLDNAEKVGQSLNEQTYKQLLNYSSPAEMVNTLERTLAGMEKLMADPAVAPLVQANLKKVMAERALKKRGNVQQQLEAIRHVAQEADTDKLSMMVNMKAVNQYATDGGSYIVTPKDRADAQAALDAVGQYDPVALDTATAIDEFANAAPLEYSPAKPIPLNNLVVEALAPSTSLNTIERVKKTAGEQLTQDLNTVQDLMIEQNIPLASAKEALSAERAADVVAAVKNNTVGQTSAWGELGTPLVSSNPDLVAFFEAAPSMTAHQLIDQLSEYTSSVFTRNLLRRVKAATKADVKVNYITSQTTAEQAAGEGVSKARGWYSSVQGVEALNFKSPEFVESGLTEELLIHELLHAALAATIQRELDSQKNRKGYKSDALDLVNDLDALRMQAAELLNNDGAMSAKYGNAVSSVHELVSWGMTNQGFQEEVLAKLTMKDVRSNSLTDALKGFIQRLSFLIFRKNATQADMNGLGMLINHTSGLLADAAHNHAGRETMTLKYDEAFDAVNKMTTEEVYDSLASVNPVSASHDVKLRLLLNSIVKSLHGPYGAFKKELMANQALTPTDAYLKALTTGKNPFISRSLASAFVLNAQEAYVLEQVEATVAESLNSADTLFARTALESLYRDARAKIKVADLHNGDWSQATPAERDIAQQKWEFLFRPETTGNNKSEYLSRFAALALASEEVSGLMNFGTTNPERQLSTLPFGGRIIELFRRILTKLASLHTNTAPGGAANVNLANLVDRLVDIEARRRARIMDRKSSLLDQTEAALSAVGDKFRSTAESVGQSTFFRASTQPLIKATGFAISAVAAERVGDIMDRITLVRDSAFKKRQGLLMGLFSELRGVTDNNLLAHHLFTDAKQNETDRKQHIDYTSAQVDASFKNGGQDLSKADRAAMTRALLRTNVSALLEGRDMTQVQELIEQPAVRKAAISALEQDLLNDPNGRYYIHATKDLAHHKVVGSSVSANQMLNTGNIANLYGTGRTAGDVSAVIPKLDQLMAMYGLEYSTKADIAAVTQVLRTEMNRGTPDNGVEMVLRLHAGLQKQSTEQLFAGTEALQTSGFTPEIHDSKIEVLWVDRSELSAFQAKGYVQAGNVQQDVTAPVQQDLVMVTRRGAGQAGILTGAFSYTGMQAKGSKLDRKAINALSGNAQTSAAIRNQVAASRKAEIDAMFTSTLSYDPRKAKSGRMVPLLDPQGNITDYRYMMTEHSRDALLDRENAMDQVLGTLAGQIVDKQSTEASNNNVVGALYDQYKSDYANRPSSYLKVGKDSTDAQLAELYRLLPESTKREIKKVWKGDNFFVPADQLNMIMGYRKYSLTSPFDAPVDGRNFAEAILVRVAGAIFGEKAELRVGQAEDVMQELVKEAKDILVIKNIVTLVGNIVSNMTILAMQGVSIPDAIRSHAVGLKGAMSYRADNKRVMQLQRALDVGYVPQGVATIENEIAELRDRIARNPVKKLIDAGLMPTIVEDVEANDSQYSYKSRLTRKVEGVTNRMPKLLRDAAKQVYMTHDTSIYKFLSQTTQLSDFVARYTMHEYLTNRAKDPLSDADAIRTVEDSFVNYDLPSHRSMQYMNDMGLVWFTKYYIRIQKTIMRLVKERPARTLAMVAANHYISGLDSVLDSSWINKIGNNPFHPGFMTFPATLDELPAVNGLMSLVK